MPIVSPFLGKGIPCDTENSLLRREHLSTLQGSTFTHFRISRHKEANCQLFFTSLMASMDHMTQSLFIPSPNESQKKVFFPLIFSPLLLTSLCFSSTRQMHCTFKKLCQILIIVFPNSVASAHFAATRHHCASIKERQRRKEPAWNSCALWAAIRRSVWS